jgi:hypothetical protein
MGTVAGFAGAGAGGAAALLLLNRGGFTRKGRGFDRRAVVFSAVGTLAPLTAAALRSAPTACHALAETCTENPRRRPHSTRFASPSLPGTSTVSSLSGRAGLRLSPLAPRLGLSESPQRSVSPSASPPVRSIESNLAACSLLSGGGVAWPRSRSTSRSAWTARATATRICSKIVGSTGTTESLGVLCLRGTYFLRAFGVAGFASGSPCLSDRSDCPPYRRRGPTGKPSPPHVRRSTSTLPSS